MGYNILDSELIYLLKEKNQRAIDIFLSRYKRNISFITNNFIKANRVMVEKDDLEQLGQIKFLECLSKYKDDKGSFYYFFKLAFERKLVDENKKKINQTFLISLDEKKEDTKIGTIEIVSQSGCPYKTSNIIEKNILKDTFKKRLTHNEFQIFLLREAGYSYREIAKFEKCSYKKIDNTIQTIKSKIKE